MHFNNVLVLLQNNFQALIYFPSTYIRFVFSKLVRWQWACVGKWNSVLCTFKIQKGCTFQLVQHKIVKQFQRTYWGCIVWRHDFKRIYTALKLNWKQNFVSSVFWWGTPINFAVKWKVFWYTFSIFFLCYYSFKPRQHFKKCSKTLFDMMILLWWSMIIIIKCLEHLPSLHCWMILFIFSQMFYIIKMVFSTGLFASEVLSAQAQLMVYKHFRASFVELIWPFVVENDSP